MANKKRFTKLAVLSLLGMIGLTACSSEVIAKPDGYATDTIVDLTHAGEDVTVFDNYMKGIYEDIREGALASDVLNDLLYQYSISVLGRYNKVISDKKASSGTADTGLTLKLAARYAGGGCSAEQTEQLKVFIRDHKAYWSTNADGKRVNDQGQVVADDTLDASASEIQRVKSKWDAIEERIAEAMYKRASEGNFKYRGKFQERAFLKELRTSLYGVETYIGKDIETVFVDGSGKLFEGLLDVDVLEKDVFKHFLHREYYQSHYGLDDDETEDQTVNFIEEEIIPDVYRQLLVEQYLFDEAYYVLGRSVARKVNVLAIAPNQNAKYTYANNLLMNKFVKDYIFAFEGSEEYNVIYGSNSEDPVKDAFDRISDMWKGVDLASYNVSGTPLDKMAATLRDFLLANNVLGQKENVEGHDFYKGTEFGDLMEKYAKIDPNPNLTDTSAENTFTNSGTYPKAVGLEIETNNVYLKHHVTSGWFIKDGGLGDLPSNIKTRLFHNIVSSSLDRFTTEGGQKVVDESTDRFYFDGNVEKYDASRDYNSKSGNAHVARIHGKYFLTTTKTEGSSDPSVVNPEDILFFDDGSKTYYLVEIQEAAASSKLSKTSATNYSTLYNNEKMEQIVNAIAGEIAQGDSYTSLSKTHWLEEMNLKYHDTVIYDYFKTNFPDLFD